MGASVAWHLARRGVTNVVLLERETQLGRGSTGRNAGGVRHQFSTESNVRLSIESIAAMERFTDEVGAPIDLHQDGYLFLLSKSEHVEAFRAAVALQRGLGVDVEWLSPGDAARYAPGVSMDDVVAATFCGRDGIADPAGLTAGYASAARRAGVEIRRGVEVTGIHVDGRGVAAVETAGEVISTRTVVNAAGPWAGYVAALAGVALPVSPLKRHIFIAAPPTSGWPISSRTMVIDFASSFYFHREGAGMLFGMGDPGQAPGFDQSVDWRVLERIQPVAARRFPCLEDASIARAWAGLYEMTPDANPVIGRCGLDGFWAIAGFSGHGFQHAPAAGRILADLMRGADPGLDPAPYRFERFAENAEMAELGVV
jgi:sarcosine oxidase subunit beta